MSKKVLCCMLVALLPPFIANGAVRTHSHRSLQPSDLHQAVSEEPIHHEVINKTAPASTLQLTMQFTRRPSGCLDYGGYWVYIDRRLVKVGGYRFEEDKANFYRIKPITDEIEVQPGRHNVAVLLELGYRTPSSIPGFPFVYKGTDQPVTFESGTERKVRLDINAEDCRIRSLVSPSKNVDEALEGMWNFVKTTTQDLNQSKVYASLMSLLSAKKLKRGEYLRLGLYDGLEFDQSQMYILGRWLEDYYWGAFEFPRDSRMPVSLDKLTEPQKKRYFEMLVLIDGSVRIIRDLSANAMNLFDDQ